MSGTAAPAPERAEDQAEDLGPVAAAARARDILDALAARWAAPGWVTAEEVQDQQGFDSGARCDFVAMGIWASTRRPLLGVEVKVSRGDWLREVGQPLKQAPLLRFLDRFYVAAPHGVVRAGELPEGWGHIVWAPGSRLKVSEPPRPLHGGERPARPPEAERSFLASFIQASRRCDSGARERAIREEVERRVADEKARLQRARLSAEDWYTRFANGVREAVGPMGEMRSGADGAFGRLYSEPEKAGEKVGHFLRTGVLHTSWERPAWIETIASLSATATQAAAAAQQLREAAAALGLPVPPPPEPPKPLRRRKGPP